MKKIVFGTCVMASMMLVACSKDSDEPKEVEKEAQETTFTVTTEGNSVTKVMWNSYNDKSWEITDQIEAYDQNGNRLVFDATSVNGNSASFSATGTLNAGSLAVFYPPTAESGYNYTIDATGQTQVGNNTVAHLKDKTYLLGHTTLENGSNSFSVTMNQILAELKWTLNLPTSVNPESVAAVAMKASSDAFKSSMVYTVVDGAASETGYTSTNEVSVDMTNMTGASSPIVAHMLASSAILSNEDVEVVAKNVDGDVIAYKEFTGVSVTYASGEIYSGTISDMTAASPSTTSWDTSSYATEYTDGQVVQEVSSDDGASKVMYINISGDNPQDFIVETSEPDGPYLEVDNMNTNNAFVLQFPIYETAAKYQFIFQIKNLHSTDDLNLKLQHKLDTQGKSEWTDMTVTRWEEQDPDNNYAVVGGGDSNAMLVSNAGHFEYLVVDFTFTEAQQTKYNKKNMQIAVDKTNQKTHDVGFKLISMEVLEQ